jgi:hypothetical protein
MAAVSKAISRKAMGALLVVILSDAFLGANKETALPTTSPPKTSQMEDPTMFMIFKIKKDVF